MPFPPSLLFLFLPHSTLPLSRSSIWIFSLVIFNSLPYTGAQDIVFLNDLLTRQAQGVRLYPSHESESSPMFYSIPSTPSSVSFVQIPSSDIELVLDAIRMDQLVATSVCSYRHNHRVFHLVNADKIDGWHEVGLNLTMQQLQETMRQNTNARVEPHHVCARGDAFDAVWIRTRRTPDHFIVQAAPLEEILKEDQVKGQQGFYPSLIQPYVGGNEVNAIAIWKKGFGVRYSIDVGTPPLRSLFPPKALSSLPHEQVILISTDEGFSWNNKTIHISRTSESIILPFVDAEVQVQMRALQIPSLSICVLFDGHLFLANSYGYSDIRNMVQATPSDFYRVASVSKTVTAMAITILIGQGRIRVDQNVFGNNGILETSLGGPIASNNPFLRAVTIRHLLEHSAGTWSHFMKLEFARKELNQSSFLDWVVRDYPPSSFPGQSYVYSNIGYIILGRIIERISGISYEQFVQKNVFEPLGVNGFVSGNTPREGEVSYYSRDNANPYLSWDAQRMDSAAGLTLTATHIAKIFGHLGRLRFSTFSLMNARSFNRWTYGKGIQMDRDGGLFHIGSMAGSEAIGFTRGRVSIGIVTNMRGVQENWITGWMESLARRIAYRMGG